MVNVHQGVYTRYFHPHDECSSRCLYIGYFHSHGECSSRCLYIRYFHSHGECSSRFLYIMCTAAHQGVYIFLAFKAPRYSLHQRSLGLTTLREPQRLKPQNIKCTFSFPHIYRYTSWNMGCSQKGFTESSAMRSVAEALCFTRCPM